MQISPWTGIHLDTMHGAGAPTCCHYGVSSGAVTRSPCRFPHGWYPHFTDSKRKNVPWTQSLRIPSTKILCFQCFRCPETFYGFAEKFELAHIWTEEPVSWSPSTGPLFLNCIKSKVHTGQILKYVKVLVSHKMHVCVCIHRYTCIHMFWDFKIRG